MLALSLAFITSLPYIIGFFELPKGSFLGTSNLLPGDYYSYLAWITEAKNGLFFLSNQYTPEYSGGILAHPLFYLVGLLARSGDLSVALAYHVSRVIALIVFTFVAYGFFATITENILERRFAVLLLTSVSGFGIFVGGFSADLYMPEMITFLSLYISPLNIVSLILVLMIFIFLTRYFSRENGVIPPIFAGVLLGLLALIHTYDVLFVGAISMLYALFLLFFRRNRAVLYYTLLMFAVSLPAILWQAHVLATDTALSVWYFQKMSVISPNLLLYISGLGVLLPLTVWGIVMLRGRSGAFPVFLALWLGGVFLLLYNPLLPQLQQKFSEGFQIPMALFAAVPLAYLWARGRMFRILVISILIFGAATNMLLLYRDVSSFSSPREPFALDQDQRSALTWIDQNTENNSVILSDPFLGNVIPAFMMRRTYIGHIDLTMNLELKNSLIANVFAYGNSVPRTWKILFAKSDIGYIIVDERKLLASRGVSGVAGLVRVFTSGPIEVYRVVR